MYFKLLDLHPSQTQLVSSMFAEAGGDGLRVAGAFG